MKNNIITDYEIPDQEFTDLGDCTTFYYDELGKLDDSSCTKREKKFIRKYLNEYFKGNLKTLKQLSKAQMNISSTKITTAHEQFKQEVKEAKNTKSHKIKYSKLAEIEDTKSTDTENKIIDGQMVIESSKEVRNEKDK